MYLILKAGWDERRQRIFTYFKPAALQRYFNLFFPSVDISHDNDVALADRFKKHYGCYYGRRHYVAPLLLLSAVAGFGLWGVSETLKNWQALAGKHFALPAVVISSFLGAFTWVASDQLARFRRRDFNSSDVYTGTFRFLIAVPFGYSLSAFANKDFGVALGFLIGVFPTDTLFKIGRRLVSENLHLGENPASGASELEMLQNVGKTNAERFYDEGVTTISELAWGDPVDLAVRTNFDFNYVVDCVSQALLAVYFGQEIQKLGPFSIRGAQEAATLLWLIDDPTVAAAKKVPATQALADAAKALNLDPNTLHHTLTFVTDDPYTRFLLQIWGPESTAAKTN